MYACTVLFQLDEIDLIAVSLETSLGSVGGFCAGTSFVVDHQVGCVLDKIELNLHYARKLKIETESTLLGENGCASLIDLASCKFTEWTLLKPVDKILKEKAK